MEDNKSEQNNLKESKELAVHYMTALIAVARESFLILDPSLRVVTCNSIFYHNFKVEPEKTEGRLLYELGNGQWDIPELRELLEEILPQKKAVTDFEVTHDFETIGKRTMMLNAKQLDSVQLIILAIEDITVKKVLRDKLALKAEDDEALLVERTDALAEKVKELEALNKTMVGRELKMVELKKEIEELKKSR